MSNNNHIIKEKELAFNTLTEFLEIVTKHLYFNKNKYMSNSKDIYSVNIDNLLNLYQNY